MHPNIQRKTNFKLITEHAFLPNTCYVRLWVLKRNIMTEKQKYIGAFLDGYFSDKKVEFGMQYYSMLNNAIDIAEKKWKKYKKQKI